MTLYPRSRNPFRSISPEPAPSPPQAGDGVILLEASTRYSAIRDDRIDPGDPINIEVHPALLARAARNSGCFAALEAAARSQPSGTADAILTSFGEGFQGADWIFEATCQDQGGADQFALNLGDVLTDRQFDLLTNGGDSELFVSRSDGTVERVDERPMTSFWADGIEGGDLIESVPAIAATNTRFWAAADGTLVSSTDGLSWDPVVLDTGGRRIGSVVANLGGDIAVLLVDDERLVHQGPKDVVVSHDDGSSWSEPVPVALDSDQDFLTNVGPAGVSLTSSGPESPETMVFVDDTNGRIGFTTDEGLGSAQLTVGRDTILLPREMIGPTGEVLGPVLDVYDTTGNLLATVEP